MGNDQRTASAAGEFPHKLEHLDAMAQVQVGRGLVQQQHLGVLGQGARHQHQLTLAARELEHRPLGQRLDADPCHGPAGVLHVRSVLEAQGTQVRRTAHQHDLAGAEGKGDVRVLGHYGDLPRLVTGRELLRVTAPHPYAPAPAAGCDHTGGDAQQGRLARAVGPCQGQHLAAGQRQRYAAQDLSRAQLHPDVLELERGVRRRIHAANARMW
jgi:hypothetical protein